MRAFHGLVVFTYFSFIYVFYRRIFTNSSRSSHGCMSIAIRYDAKINHYLSVRYIILNSYFSLLSSDLNSYFEMRMVANNHCSLLNSKPIRTEQVSVTVTLWTNVSQSLIRGKFFTVRKICITTENKVIDFSTEMLMKCHKSFIENCSLLKSHV
jgi:hypothetical protein